MKELLKEAIDIFLSLREVKTRDKHMSGFVEILRKNTPDGLILKKEIPIEETEYRSKKWDHSVWNDETWTTVIEFKSLDKSPGNNSNNRMEEAMGCAWRNKTSFPDRKRGYWFVGVNLPELYRERWILFLNHCLTVGLYDAVCCILLDEQGQPSHPTGMAPDEFFVKLFP